MRRTLYFPVLNILWGLLILYIIVILIIVISSYFSVRLVWFVSNQFTIGRYWKPDPPHDKAFTPTKSSHCRTYSSMVDFLFWIFCVDFLQNAHLRNRILGKCGFLFCVWVSSSLFSPRWADCQQTLHFFQLSLAHSSSDSKRKESVHLRCPR